MQTSPKKTMNPSSPPALYHATTLLPNTEDPWEPLVIRGKTLSIINGYRTASGVSTIVGPIGSGKTTVAFQWAQHHGKEIQYVGVRSYASVPDGWVSEPSEFGQALADLLNSCSQAVKDPSQDQIHENFERFVTLAQQADQRFVIDDLEMLGREALAMLHPMMVQGLPKMRIDQALFLSRSMDSYSLSSLQARGPLRMVLPSSLDFDASEAEEAHRLGVFGTATLEQVEAARRDSSGWILGMLNILKGHGGKIVDSLQMHNYLLNEMLLTLSDADRHAIVASAFLPINTRPIWERWFEYLETPERAISATVSQLPIRTVESGPDNFELLPVMRDNLKRLSHITAKSNLLDELIRIALESYVENDELDAAVQLATEQQLEQHLLTCMKPICAQHAETENWAAIHRLLSRVPEDVLIQDSDLTFWYFHGLVETDQWAVMRGLQDRVMPLWDDSPDPLVRGRADMVKSWGAYMLNQGDAALWHSSSAYNTLPETAHRERLWAAGTASIAESLRGNSAEARQWSALASFEITFMQSPSRWWHNNPGPLRYSWLAIRGMLEESYEYAARQSLELRDVNAACMTRYLLLQAQIDVERYRFDAAEILLERASSVMEPFYSQPYQLRLVQANLARARGETELAWDILSQGTLATPQRYDQYARESLARTRIALDSGDISAAELSLESAPSLVDVWPQDFGGAHPQLLNALILTFRGVPDQAIATAETTLAAAMNRNQTHYVVTAYSTLAYIYHQTGAGALRNQMIDSAQAAAGQSGFQLAFVICGEDVRELRSVEDVEPVEQQTTVTPELPLDLLTTRELEALTLVAQSLTNKQIAEQMFISVSTVKNHLGSAFDKLGTKNRREAVKLAKTLGVVSE